MSWLLIFLVAIVIAWVVIHWIQLRVLFNPTRDHIYDPQGYQEVYVDGLHTWHFVHDPNARTILHCHGNSYNISHLSHIIRLCKKAQLNLLVWDYSGYGKSKGSPSPNQVYADGEKIYNYLASKVNPDQIIVWGESLGGAVATHIASKFPCSTLVLISTFSSIDDIVLDSHPGVLSSLGCFILRGALNMMPSKEKLSLVQCPVVVAHSIEDELIPYTNAERMFKTIPHRCKKFIAMTGRHAAPKLNGQILSEILSFCCINTNQCYQVDDILCDIARGHIM